MIIRTLSIAACGLCVFAMQAHAEYGCHITNSIKYDIIIKRCESTVVHFKKLHPCPSTGLSHGRCPGYVVDHIIALKRGGPDAVENMQWQTTADAKAKDKWE